MLAAAEIAVFALIGAGSAIAQSASQEKPLMAEQVFKNVRVAQGNSSRRFHGDHGAHFSRPFIRLLGLS